MSVPIRLSDPDVAALLHPGATMDVVTLGERQDQPVVLARGARVLTVLAEGQAPGEQGRLVLVALDPDAETRVAGASLSQAVTVTVLGEQAGVEPASAGGTHGSAMRQRTPEDNPPEDANHEDRRFATGRPGERVNQSRNGDQGRFGHRRAIAGEAPFH